MKRFGITLPTKLILNTSLPKQDTERVPLLESYFIDPTFNTICMLCGFSCFKATSWNINPNKRATMKFASLHTVLYRDSFATIRQTNSRLWYVNVKCQECGTYAAKHMSTDRLQVRWLTHTHTGAFNSPVTHTGAFPYNANNLQLSHWCASQSTQGLCAVKETTAWLTLHASFAPRWCL